MLASTLIVTVLDSAAPTRPAACWKAFLRACPSVVALFPPTGVKGVGSLNPSLGPSR